MVVRLNQSDQAGSALTPYPRHLAQHLLLREAIGELGDRVELIVAAFEKVKQRQPQSESGQAGAGQLAEQAPWFGGGNRRALHPGDQLLVQVMIEIKTLQRIVEAVIAALGPLDIEAVALDVGQTLAGFANLLFPFLDRVIHSLEFLQDRFLGSRPLVAIFPVEHAEQLLRARDLLV